MVQFFIQLAENGLLSDLILRHAMRRLLRKRLEQETGQAIPLQAFTEHMGQFPVAVHTADSKQQHYEVPAAFYRQVLGPHLKYSSGFWPEGTDGLEDAEARMLALSCERGQLQDGQRILELGCGWGSLTLWMAVNYPDSSILSVSHSASQRAYIEAQCRRRGLTNVEVQTCDMNDFHSERKFDRVMSVEMFEHMRNHRELMRRISTWLQPDGKLFVHIFTHHTLRYLFETEGAQNWMGHYFFTGGMMPSHDLLPAYNEHLALEKDWSVNGVHYSRTLEAWLDKQDAAEPEIMKLFAEVYGEGQARAWFNRWRMFFMACSELFRYNEGREWGVSHYLFRNRG